MDIKEIKQLAKMKLKGKYWKCASACLIQFIVLIFLSIILEKLNDVLEDFTLLITVIQAIFALISSVLSYALISNILDLSSEKTKSITNFIDKTFLNFTKYVKVVFSVLIRTLIPAIIFILCIFYLIGTSAAYVYEQNFLCFYSNLVPFAIILCIISLIVLMYYMLKYVLVAYVYYNNTDLTATEVVQKSNELMKKQKIKFALLILSFIGWFIILAVILGVLGYFIDAVWMTPIIVVFYSLIRPYIIVSESIFVDSLAEK